MSDLALLEAIRRRRSFHGKVRATLNRIVKTLPAGHWLRDHARYMLNVVMIEGWVLDKLEEEARDA